MQIVHAAHCSSANAFSHDTMVFAVITTILMLMMLVNICQSLIERKFG